MDVRSGKQDGRHRTFWCVFWAKAAADAAAGVVKRSAHRCDELHAALMASCTCEAAVWSAVVPQRVRAIGHYLQQRSMRNKRQLTYSCALFSLSQLKQVLAASKTLASSRTREGPLWAALRISRSPPGAL